MATDSVTVSPTFNGDSVSLTSGMIVRLKPGANNNVVRAQADSAPHVQGVNGVVVSGASAPTGIVTGVCTGRETVQMESGLTPIVGQTVFVSAATAGKGTNVQPGIVVPIGVIADITGYARTNSVVVDVNIAVGSGGGGAVTSVNGDVGDVIVSELLNPSTSAIDAQVDANDNVAVGAQAQIPTAAINGFVFVPSMHGAPTGVPAAPFTTGAAKMAGVLWDDVGKFIWVWDQASGTWISVSSTFGSDVIVDLPNSAAAEVQALRLTTSFVDNTAGHEFSRWILQALVDGTPTTAQDIQGAATAFPVGTFQAPSLTFLGQTGSGLSFDVANQRIGWDIAAGAPSSTGGFLDATGMVIQHATGRVVISTGLDTSFSRTAPGDAEITMGRDLSVGTPVALGLAAVAGFIDVPSCAGNPTGVATPATGKTPLVVDTANSRLDLFIGGAWAGIPVAAPIAAGAGVALINTAPAGVVSLAAKWETFRDAAGVLSYRPYFQ